MISANHKDQSGLERFGLWNKKQIEIPDLKTDRKYRIGYLTSDRVFMMYRQLRGKFKIYNGWGVNVNVLKDLEEKGCRQVRMMVRDGKILKYILLTTPSHWLQRGLDYVNEKLNGEKQLILTEESFDQKLIANLEVIK